MGEFVDVYSKTTGKKRSIPAHWLDIPAFADKFRKTPTQKDIDTALDLKGKDLEDALDEAGLPKTGTADEKRLSLAEHYAKTSDEQPVADGAAPDAPSDPTDPLEPNETPHGGETDKE